MREAAAAKAASKREAVAAAAALRDVPAATVASSKGEPTATTPSKPAFQIKCEIGLASRKWVALQEQRGRPSNNAPSVEILGAFVQTSRGVTAPGCGVQQPQPAKIGRTPECPKRREAYWSWRTPTIAGAE
jgi:hypothetical protein